MLPWKEHVIGNWIINKLCINQMLSEWFVEKCQDSVWKSWLYWSRGRIPTGFLQQYFFISKATCQSPLKFLCTIFFCTMGSIRYFELQSNHLQNKGKGCEMYSNFVQFWSFVPDWSALERNVTCCHLVPSACLPSRPCLTAMGGNKRWIQVHRP